MFEFSVIGLSVGVYTNKRGESKPYTRLYVTYPLDEANYSNCSCKGTGCESIFINKHLDHLDDVCIGDLITPVYNKFGTCVDIIIH